MTDFEKEKAEFMSRPSVFYMPDVAQRLATAAWDKCAEVYEKQNTELRQQLQELQATVEQLKGIKPDILDGFNLVGAKLPRYGIRWNGPSEPIAVAMPDGYWTPHHVAMELKAQWQAEAIRDRWLSEINKLRTQGAV